MRLYMVQAYPEEQFSRVWVSVGYFFVGCLLAIVYRTAKNAKLKKEEEEEAERQRLAYEYVKGERPDFGENSVYEKQVWEGPAPSAHRCFRRTGIRDATVRAH